MIGLIVCDNHGEPRLEICDCGETDLGKIEMRDGWVICSNCGEKALMKYLLPSQHAVPEELIHSLQPAAVEQLVVDSVELAELVCSDCGGVNESTQAGAGACLTCGQGGSPQATGV